MEVTHTCSTCKLEKNLTEFYKDKRNKSGFFSSCKKCQSIKTKELRQNYSRQEREIKLKKVCSRCKKEKKVLEFAKDRCSKDGFYGECKACKYKYNHAYSEARKKYDPKFKLLKSLRSRLSEALRGKSKSQTTRQLLGIDFEIFTKWIKFQFETGMTMDNYGSAWCHDHVLPISSFNLLEEEELQKAMNWMNIRPLTPFKNNQKSNKIDRWLYVMQEVKAHYFLKHLDEL